MIVPAVFHILILMVDLKVVLQIVRRLKLFFADTALRLKSLLRPPILTYSFLAFEIVEVITVKSTGSRVDGNVVTRKDFVNEVMGFVEDCFRVWNRTVVPDCIKLLIITRQQRLNVT